MSRYIFFARTIGNVGGAQLYLNAKASYLAANGWDVSIVYDRGGASYLPKLQEYPSILIEELHRPAFKYLSWKRKILTKKIIDFLGTLESGDIIESHSQALSSWAEIISMYYGQVRHFIYELDERPEIPKEMINYYKFKYYRKELVGILEQSIALFFEGTGTDLKYGSPFLAAYGAADCVLDIPCHIVFEKKEEYVIGIVGRLEKPYVMEYAKSTATFVSTHPAKNFIVVVIGGEPQGDTYRKNIELLFNELSNVTLLMTGYLFPIPSSLVTKFDLCLAGAGAAYGVSNEGVTTLPIDPRDFMSSGVIGLNTENAVFSNEEKKSILWWLEEIFVNPEKYKMRKQERIRHDFESHMKYLVQCSSDYEYNVSFLKCKSLKLFVTQLLCSFLSVKNSEYLSNLINS